MGGQKEVRASSSLLNLFPAAPSAEHELILMSFSGGRSPMAALPLIDPLATLRRGGGGK